MMVEFRQAMHDPAGVFGKPINVVHEDAFSYKQKKTILLEWELDAQAVLRADEENMFTDSVSMLSRVHRALMFLEEEHVKSELPDDHAAHD